jgi:hypothetical protein
MEFLVGWLLLAAAVGWVASNRGRSGIGYFFLSLVLSPLIGLIAVLVQKDLQSDAQQTASAEEEQRREHQRRIEEIRALQPVATGPSKADEIEKLAKLRDGGLLTDEEFQTQKRIVLSR